MSEKIVLTKMELLRMARELVINEYIDKRAQDHNKWLIDADVAWKTRGINLPYPSFPIYPTEADILARATVLNTFLSQDTNTEKAIVEPVDVAEVAKTVKPEAIVPEVIVPEVIVPEVIASKVVTSAAPQVVTITKVTTPANDPVATPPLPLAANDPVSAPIMPVVDPTLLNPSIVPPSVWANIAPVIQPPAEPSTSVPLPTFNPVDSDTTLSVIAQLKAKLGLK